MAEEEGHGVQARVSHCLSGTVPETPVRAPHHVVEEDSWLFWRHDDTKKIKGNGNL